MYTTDPVVYTNLFSLNLAGLINSPTDLKAMLPVEVDISDLVSNFNVRFQALGDNVTRLGDQLRIIEEENARAQNALKEEVAKCKCDYGYTGENCNEGIKRI